MSTQQYIKIIVSDVETNEIVELPIENDNTILLSTIQCMVPDATSLGYRNSATNLLRVLRIIDGRVYPEDNKWVERIYLVISNDKKRKSPEEEELSTTTNLLKKIKSGGTTDLIILGLGFTCTEDDITEYFAKYGQLKSVQIIRYKNGNSKGYAFIHCESLQMQTIILTTSHLIKGRLCGIKIPAKQSDDQYHNRAMIPNRLYVGNLTEDISTVDLREYFSKFGKISDVLKIPHRTFGFVEFENYSVVSLILDSDALHILKRKTLVLHNCYRKTETLLQENSTAGLLCLSK